MGYLRPVPFSRSTSWDAHRRRRPPSTEAGIDMFVPIGTPVLAIESGRVVDVGDSIGPATGRFVTIDLDDGRRVRYLHLSRRVVKGGDRVARGQAIGYSGATGYGEEDWSWNVAETGGAHVHMTLWPSHRYVFGSSGTLDPELYFDAAGSVAGGNATPLEEDDMDITELYNWRTSAQIGGVNRNIMDMLVWLNDRQEQINTRQEQIVADQKARDGDLSSLVAGVKADINYIHTLSPYSLRAILAASGRGEVKLTDAQAAAIAGQLSATLAASLDAALKDDFAGVIAAIKGQPAATVAAIKAAL